jgi:hypothetical protein
MSQGFVRLRYDGEESELYEAEVVTWDNSDGVYEIHFSGVGKGGPFRGSCALERVGGGWTYAGRGRWQNHDDDEVYTSAVRVQLRLVGKLLVLEGHWLEQEEDEAYDLYIEIEGR